MKRSPVYMLGGAVIGIIAVIFIVSAGSAFIDAVMGGSGAAEIAVMFAFCLLAVGAFLLIMRKVTRPKFATLKNYYLMSAVLTFTLVMILLGLMFDLVGDYMSRLAEENSARSSLIGIIIVLLIIVIGAAVFLLVFSLLTRRKSDYIRYICDEVQKLSHDDSIVLDERGGDELSEISRSVNQMSAELREKREREKELERQRSELITNVSHDLRSPLTSIIGYVKLLKENGCEDKEKFNEYIEVTDRRLAGLNKLVNELFELTRLDVPNLILNYESCDVTGFIKQFGFEMGLMLEQEGLTLECALDDKLFIMELDIDRMARVMQNLFANVIKYADKAAAVRLTSKVSEGGLTISLSNRIKPGREPDTVNMFNRFYKADRARSDTASAGLGLAIAKRIVELHGGSIFADVSGGVLTVTVKLNVKRQ